MIRYKKEVAQKKIYHLYDPKTEGLGLYDVNYINAYKKERWIKQNKSQKQKPKEKEVA